MTTTRSKRNDALLALHSINGTDRVTVAYVNVIVTSSEARENETTPVIDCGRVSDLVS